MAKHTFRSLMARLTRAGFSGEFVRPAILPDWWEDSCGKDAALLPDIEIRVARFLGLPISTIRDPDAALTLPAYTGVQLRRVKDLDRDRLRPAIHSAMQVARAVVRNLRVPRQEMSVPPADGLEWRGRIARPSTAVTLSDLVADLWTRGIPVVPLDVIPAPSFQGAACIADGHPVILLGHKRDEPGRVAFIVAHEAGHVAAGDASPDQPVVDEEDEVPDDADVERAAERYATRVLVGTDPVPSINGGDYRELAKRASQLERTSGADASVMLFAWARRNNDYPTATMAVNALYRGSGARRQLREHFDRNVDLDAASESDRALLRCVYGEPERDAAAHRH